MIFGKPSGTGAVKKVPDQGLLLSCVLVAAFFGVLTAVFGGLISAVLLLTIVAAGVTLANYRLGLWFLVLLLPLTATTIFPHQVLGITGANPYNMLFGLTLLSFLADQLRKQQTGWDMAYPRFWWAYLAPIVIAALVGVLHFSEIPAFAYSKGLVTFTSASGYLRDILLKPLTYILLALLLEAAGRDGMKPSAVIVAMCLSIWLLAAWVFAYVLYSGIGLSQLASATQRQTLSGVGMHANELGVLSACMLTLMVFAIANTDKTVALRWLYVMTAGISGALLLISFSRGGFLALVVGLAVFFIVQRRPRTVIVGLFVLAIILPILPVELYERLSTGMSTGGKIVLYSSNDPLTAGRVAGIWIPMLSEVRSHPLFGNGLLSIAWSMPFRSGALSIATLSTHSMYLKILLEVGLVGLVLLAFFFVDLWRRFRAAAKDPATPRQLAWLFDGSAAAFIGYAAAGLSGADYMPAASNFWLWVAWGLLLAVTAGRLRATKGSERLSRADEANPRRRGV